MKENNIIEIIGENYFGSYERTRSACRGIVIKNGKILLSYETKIDLWMIPGGGKELGESDEDCVIRELAEETGYIVRVKKQTVKLIEYYEDTRYITLYFLCEIINEITPQLTEGEKAEGLERRWVLLDDSLTIFSEHNKFRDIFEEKRGLYLREYSALLKMIDNKDISRK